MINKCFFGSGTSLLWIMGESAGEGLWLLALVTGGSWHVTCDTWHVICQTWLVTHDTWFFLNKKCQKSHEKWQKCNNKKWLKSAQKCRNVSQKGYFIVLILLSAHGGRVGVSRVRDFYFLWALCVFLDYCGIFNLVQIKAGLFISKNCKLLKYIWYNWGS